MLICLCVKPIHVASRYAVRRAASCAAAKGTSTASLSFPQEALHASAGTGAMIVEHATFHHNVPMYLEREGLLVRLFKSECEALLRPEELAVVVS